MKPIGASIRTVAALAALVVLAGCAGGAENPTRISASGETEIALRDGLNCHAGDCLTASLGARTVSRPNMAEVKIPASVDISDGHVTAAEFAALSRAARAAPQKMHGAPGAGGLGR